MYNLFFFFFFEREKEKKSEDWMGSFKKKMKNTSSWVSFIEIKVAHSLAFEFQPRAISASVINLFPFSPIWVFSITHFKNWINNDSKRAEKKTRVSSISNSASGSSSLLIVSNKANLNGFSGSDKDKAS